MRTEVRNPVQVPAWMAVAVVGMRLKRRRSTLGTAVYPCMSPAQDLTSAVVVVGIPSWSGSWKKKLNQRQGKKERQRCTQNDCRRKGLRAKLQDHRPRM